MIDPVKHQILPNSHMLETDRLCIWSMSQLFYCYKVYHCIHVLYNSQATIKKFLIGTVLLERHSFVINTDI